MVLLAQEGLKLGFGTSRQTGAFSPPPPPPPPNTSQLQLYGTLSAWEAGAGLLGRQGRGCLGGRGGAAWEAGAGLLGRQGRGCWGGLGGRGGAAWEAGVGLGMHAQE